ncbi:hypothetical protein [Lentibacillus amyloliquefaciens]|uniref:Uncharacterized protein n=1 Tax=Lentibacillus amyloliquefaciens TaxID=1472767 RepID=A0A0U4E6L2_9BACI|nr:hypothetical protein [Lentibacillus amyloliquefaciens]ALX48908.1 hypothetical protein AOX59_09955 [Lentibacillus amyloliquefaciens]
MNENMIAKVLFVIGVAQIAAGVIIGLITANIITYGVSWPVFFAWMLGGFVSGMLFIGFAENIRLLHNIHKKMQPLNKTPDTRQEPSIKNPRPEWTLDEADRTKIYEHYPNETIVEVVPAPQEDYCLVRFKSDNGYYVRVVYTGGFGIEETSDAKVRQSIIKWYNEQG